MLLSLIGYDPVGAWTKTADTAAELLTWKNPSGITWINVECFDNLEEINRLAELFKIHPLTVEDILDTFQRPKTEEFDDYLFITFKAANPSEGLVFEHMSLLITDDAVITFQEKPGDYFDGIRKRILNNAGRIRRMGTDYLAYAIIDAVVDEYFIIIDSLGSEIEDFEERVIDKMDDTFIQDIQDTKRELLKVRRVVWPLRESLSLLMHLDSKRIGDELEPFLKDLYDHIIQAAETIETYRELIAGIMEVYLTAASNRLSKVMKVLTIISTIFIPLTFIVGVYGMNFRFMPELEYPLAYPIVWGIMTAIALGMLLFFKRRKWI
ncbi:MAG: magnesium/cobalt transporter CorA [Treponema sp.]|jgi:magnesium transporter|nr:magnesium/cobalt transporter CorA [Treponema sp.]